MSELVTLRDEFRERHWLSEVSHGDERFVDLVAARLQAGQELYGDSWAWIGAEKLISELVAEALDLGAWAVLCDQALDRDTDLTELHRRQLRSVLRVAAQAGARAHALLDQALTSIDRTGRSGDLPPQQDRGTDD